MCVDGGANAGHTSLKLHGQTPNFSLSIHAHAHAQLTRKKPLSRAQQPVAGPKLVGKKGRAWAGLTLVWVVGPPAPPPSGLRWNPSAFIGENGNALRVIVHTAHSLP